jgi:hypothetical protein
MSQANIAFAHHGIRSRQLKLKFRYHNGVQHKVGVQASLSLCLNPDLVLHSELGMIALMPCTA